MRRTKPNPFADMPGDLRRAVAADPICAYALRGLECRNARPGEQCGCARMSALGQRMPRLDELRDVLDMLQQADSNLTDLRPDAAQQTLRDAIMALALELGTNATTPQQRYAQRVAAQTARIDAALNEEGRKQRARRKR